MAKHELTFKKERETKNTIRYQEESNPGKPQGLSQGTLAMLPIDDMQFTLERFRRRLVDFSFRPRVLLIYLASFNLWFPTFCKSLEHAVAVVRKDLRALRRWRAMKELSPEELDVFPAVEMQCTESIRHLRYTAAMLAFSFCQARLIEMAEGLSKGLAGTTHPAFDEQHGYHDNLYDAWRYLDKLKVDTLKNSTERKEIETLHALRNCLVHNDGNATGKRYKGLRHYAKRHPKRISLHRNSCIFIRSQYLELIRAQIASYFKRFGQSFPYDELNRHRHGQDAGHVGAVTAEARRSAATSRPT